MPNKTDVKIIRRNENKPTLEPAPARIFVNSDSLSERGIAAEPNTSTSRRKLRNQTEMMNVAKEIIAAIAG